MDGTRQNVCGADLLLTTIANQGGHKLFGCHGEVLLPIFDKMTEHKELTFIQMKHEQAAVHAADGYARAVGKAGFALIGAGPAAANAVTGIATAYSDSVPLVVIACQIERDKIGKDSFQEVDISGLMIPITKYYIRVDKAESFPEAIEKARIIAESDRPGPVVVEVPVNTLRTKVDKLTKRKVNILEFRKQTVKKAVSEHVVNHVVNVLSEAKKPIILIGGGCIISGTSDLLHKFIEKTRIPVVTTLMGIGGLSSTNPLHLGMLGMHGTFAANKAVHNCDVLLCLGVRFSDRVTGKISGFSPKSVKIQVDIDPSEINKIVPIDIPIVADVKSFLTELDKQLNPTKIMKNCAKWVEEVTNFKKTVPRFDKVHSVLKPQEVLRYVDQYSNDDAIVVTDVGQHQIFTAHHYKFIKPRTFLSSGGLGTMGYGFPAAIGAAVAADGKQIICITGDGSFQMNLQELITAFKYKLPIKIIILNNGYLGMVRQWQELFYNRRYSSVKISSPNFIKLAEAYGIVGLKAKTAEEAEKIIQEGFKHHGPTLLEFDVMEEENVYPMVPPGASNSEVILSR
ncbi:biosynthetic-type acetolactate synthase large subunit [Calidifontibacillus erzurumensis]|uniref:Acetolactate synthase n=1 Tax=Calidifontibacillus erzurumensis TaxID=2741433 RepID=A0A8J8GEX5_9BACI|nr:biosynthetic-type acetolactate synthase large subunit [Calidifontibacillus erzurumensis]NSL52635.1 biosynthetic-type acetolactate synthase large subunit [Calidifontibacillus erzurumensis]